MTSVEQQISLDPIGTHGTSAKVTQIDNMYLDEHLKNISLQPSLLGRKKVPRSESKWEVAGYSDENEEEENEDYDDEEEVDEPCVVCLKEYDHWFFDCPYLVCIPDPENVTLGKGYDFACVHCGKFGRPCHSRWDACATMKYCDICGAVASHWHTECPNDVKSPKKPCPENTINDEFKNKSQALV